LTGLARRFVSIHSSPAIVVMIPPLALTLRRKGGPSTRIRSAPQSGRAAHPCCASPDFRRARF